MNNPIDSFKFVDLKSEVLANLYFSLSELCTYGVKKASTLSYLYVSSSNVVDACKRRGHLRFCNCNTVFIAAFSYCPVIG